MLSIYNNERDERDDKFNVNYKAAKIQVVLRERWIHEANIMAGIKLTKQGIQKRRSLPGKPV